VETHVDLKSSAKESFTFYYDGATPEQPGLTTARGLLSAVSGDGFVRRLEHRADGKLARRTLELAGWRTVTSEFDYFENGDVRTETTRVTEADGAPLSTMTRTTKVDGFGRPASLSLDGQLLVTIGYDENGLPASAAFADGTSATFHYDDLTRR